MSEAPTFRTLDTNALADHLFVTFQGAFNLSRSMNDPRHMRAQLAVSRQLKQRRAWAADGAFLAPPGGASLAMQPVIEAGGCLDQQYS